MTGRATDAKIQAGRARALRRSSPDGETALWGRLRGRQVAGAKFRRQEPFGPYILDFCCLERRVVIEVDGSQHAEERQMARDAVRTAYLEARGFRVLRFDDREVLLETESVMQQIWQVLQTGPSP